MRQCRLIVFLTVAARVSMFANVRVVDAFGTFLPNLFGSTKGENSAVSTKRAEVEQQQRLLIQAIDSTNNGKTATPTQQAQILRLVRNLETFSLSLSIADPTIATLLNGTWYLQYTSPSVVEVPNDAGQNGSETEDWTLRPDETWQPVGAKEGATNIETRPFAAQGTVSAAGITVDTSNKVVQQIINVTERTVVNVVNLPWGSVTVAGTFRQSPVAANRAIVAFDTATIRVGNAINIQLGFLFAFLGFLRKSRDNGWLETTFINEELRVGRGNKGTMFVLTRDPGAVQP